MKKLIFLIALSLSMTFGNGSNSQAATTPPAPGQTPVTAAMLLEREPLIKGIDYDIPATAEEIAKCTFASTPEGGYVVKDGSGKTLRTFLTRPGGGIQAGYYKNGVEVFRQSTDPRDAKKPNEFRWLNNAGTRHGTGTAGAIQWQKISAEEISIEVVSALASKNVAQFMSLAPNAEELQALGLSKDQDAKVKQKIAQMQPGFVEAVKKITLSPNAVWIQFSGGKPGTVPAENGSNTQDIVAYENAIVLLQDGEGMDSVKQIQLGTLVKIGDNNWRLIGTPQLEVPGASQSFGEYTFFPSGIFGDSPSGGSAPGAPSSEIVKTLEELDKKQAAIRSAPVDQRAPLYEEVLKLMLKCAMQQSTHEQAEYWVRQAADIVEGGAINNEYPGAAKRLGELFTSVKEQFPTQEAAAYVKFRQIMSEYYLQLHSSPDPSPANVNRVKSLEEFINEFKGSEGAARAMSELAGYYEMVQDTNEALKWYKEVEAAAPNLIQGKRATGAIRRITSIGKVVPFTAKASNGAAFNLAQLKGNIVVLYFWSSWSEPESSGLKSIATQNRNVRVIGVNLDARTEDMTKHLEKNPMPFPQIHETAPDGESVPGLYWGVQVPPMIILIDAEGKVVKQDLPTAGMLARALDELKKQ